MRIVSFIIMALVSFALGAFFLYHRYDRMMENRRIEAMNDRISGANRVVERITTLDSNSRDCTDWLVGLTTGTFQQPSLKPRVALQFAQSCDTQMNSSADKSIDTIQRLENSSEAEGALAFFTAARDLTAAYRAQSQDFGRATELLTETHEAGASLSRHQGAVVDLVNRRLPAINDGLEEFDTTRRAFITPNG